MIKIKIKYIKKDKIINFLVKGHAKNKKENKTNILCAITSTIILGGINLLNKTEEKNINIKNYNGYSEINILNTNQNIQTIIQTMIAQFQTMVLYFKKNITIEFKLIN